MSDMARKMILLEGEAQSSNLPTAIFGTASRLSQAITTGPQYRIGMWPCISPSDPHVAMGIFTALCFLIEQGWKARVYRIFSRLEDKLPSAEWGMSSSQFTPDDWEIDGLDENVAIWGTLMPSATGLAFEIQIENDLSETDDVVTLPSEHTDLANLVDHLPEIANKIALVLDLEERDSLRLSFDSRPGDALNKLLTDLFQWEVKLLLILQEYDWTDDDIYSAFDQLRSSSTETGGFGQWALASAVHRAMLPGFSVVGELLVSSVADIAAEAAYQPVVAVRLSRGLYRLGYTDEAYDLLLATIEAHPAEAAPRWVLGEYYTRARRVQDALTVYQEAIESKAVDKQLYLNYAGVLLVYASQNWDIEQSVLLAAEKAAQRDNAVLEAIEAYQAILDSEPENLDVLYLQLSQFAENGITDRRFWPGFARLVELDATGEYVHNLLDAFYNIEDISPAINTLTKKAKAEPTRHDLRLNLATAYLLDENGDAARLELEAARKMTRDPAVLAEIDRMMLSADDPDFEWRMAEMSEKAEAGRTLEVEEVEFLEDIVDQVPTFAEGYLLLAKAYGSWNEPATAIETLLDGQKHLPNDPDILELLARFLWDSGERALAFDYLNRALIAHPTHVPALALTAQYLYEDDQPEKAKEFLRRAEAIAPYHSALNRVRLAIARMVGEEAEEED